MQKLRTTLNLPAYRLITAIAYQNWGLLAINLVANLLSAVLEGSTLGVIYLAVSILSQGQQSQQPQFLKQLLSAFSLTQSQQFLALLGCAVLLQILLALSGYTNKLSTAYLSARAQPQVTGRIFEQIMSFSFACASQYKVGDLVMFVNDAAMTVNRQIQTVNELIVSLTFSSVYALVLIQLSPALALVAVLLALVVIGVQQRLLPQLRSAAFRLNSAQVELSKHMTENIQALRLLHTFGTQQRAIAETFQLLHNVQTQLQKRAKVFYLPEPIFDVLPVIALAVLASLTMVISSTPESILPLLLTFLLTLQRLAIRLRGVAGAFTQLADNSANLQRLSTILDRRNKQFVTMGGENFELLQTDINFKQVSLSYTNDENFVLQNLSFTIPKNQVTALVGQSGAGKSSIVDLLIGLYQPNLGQIIVNGKPLEYYNQAAWRQRIGVVSQDTFIFNSSILDNLRHGAPEATPEAVIEAAKAAQAHHFIVEMPEGYDTIVGERGYRLSGGQRQRLALARAVLKQPEILILDEATSALDSESERLIQQALARFQKDRTVIVIAHRLSTIAEADQIIVLEKGQIVESGNHRALMNQHGRYACYWDLQTQNMVI
ncbi:ABC transporter ATP-binding protein/permease [Leptolyngbya sp. FACHB-17]|uniref:ABC transporter ATP-binding protein n=1 Tax=unclassified Leptolyngbya TaxID=2650499 RepID=UPI001680F9C3|nr:ABC transporter ATP-binding protein/permease [Leptolyngbya sp. FACHB-17]MBD2081297.1 ABC transporter ATP-binding protein/permease [Leptolyngbya sp. FACHB-17]